MEIGPSVIEWLLSGDPSVGWQALRDLADADPETVAAERSRVGREGWGRALLDLQDDEGTWAGGLYGPKWTSTTYTMLLLRRLGVPDDQPEAVRATRLLLDRGLAPDDGISYFPSHPEGEGCVTGLVLSLAATFTPDDERIPRIVEHLLGRILDDGGWNCRDVRGDTHGSFHTTISVLEGLHVARLAGWGTDAVDRSMRGAREFLLDHRLYRSHRTGNVVRSELTRFSFPPRWYYDVLRALDHFAACGAPYDQRLEDAMGLLERRRRPDGRWLLQNRHPGRTHFEMEKVGEPSRWNTLRALRVLRWWENARRGSEPAAP